MNLFSFNKMMLLKLLEIAQYTILAGLFAIIFGPLINILLPVPPHSNFSLILYIIIELGLLGIFTYYIRKFILLIPFFFASFDKSYKVKRASSLLAVGIGLGLVFNRTQTNLLKRIDILIIYFKNLYGS